MKDKTKLWLVPFGSLIGGIGIGNMRWNIYVGSIIAITGFIMMLVGRKTYFKVMKNLKN